MERKDRNAHENIQKLNNSYNKCATCSVSYCCENVFIIYEKGLYLLVLLLIIVVQTNNKTFTD